MTELQKQIKHEIREKIYAAISCANDYDIGTCYDIELNARLIECLNYIDTIWFNDERWHSLQGEIEYYGKDTESNES